MISDGALIASGVRLMLPTTADVASLTRTRTQPRVGGGVDTGDFTEFTAPTATQVELLIARAGRAVEAVLGTLDRVAETTPAGVSLAGAIRDLIAVRAAAELERSYFGAASDMYKSLMDQYDGDLKRLTESMREYAADGTPDAGMGLLPMASGLIDEPVVPVVRYVPWA